MSTHSTHVLREYAVVAVGWRGMVIGPRGDIAGMCHPRWDSDAVFSSLVGGPGVYSVTPDDAEYVWVVPMRQGSLIWRSRWVTTARVVECREALGYPGDPHRAVILRRLRCVKGQVRVRVVLDARAEFGAQAMTDLAKDSPVWTGTSGALRLRWSGADAATRREGGLVMLVDLETGDQHDLVLEMSDRALPGAGPPRPGLEGDMSEGAFLVCGFHMALALHQQGQETQAARWFERNRSACGSPGLFTEKFDIVQRQLRGNVPQAFVHALMFESARRLADPAPGNA